MIKDNVKIVCDKINAVTPVVKRDGKVTLIAATKTRSAEEIALLSDCNVFDVGENRVQELIEKFPKLQNFKWHFIGRLQTNKVKYIIDKVCLIHSLDRLNLAEEIQKQCEKRNINASVLIEINIGEEESKGGILKEDTESFIKSLEKFDRITVKGLMCVLPKKDIASLETMCLQMYNLYVKIKNIKQNNLKVEFLSMGMTEDYEIAVKYGSNMVRVGRAIFGERL